MSQGGGEDVEVFIAVENKYPSSVQVTAVGGGAEVWRGEVRALADAVFRVRSEHVRQGRVRYLLEPRASRERYLTPRSGPVRNDTVRIVIMEPLDRSFVEE